MTVAEIHGKISEEGINLSERMEDLLTSDIFGCMRYLPAQKVLIPFLRRVRSFYGNALTVPVKVIKVHYSFWPWLKSPGCIPCEPDVVLGLETEGRHVHMVLVEAKYYSGLSSEENESVEPNDQLARELDNLEAASCATLGWRPQLEIASRAVLFVTRDMGMPRELLRQSLAAYRQKRKKEGDIFWASWRFLPSILEQSLQNESNSEHAAVLEDMLLLLLRKELIMFPGIKPITGSFYIPDFYYTTPTIYRWPANHKPMRIDYEYGVLK